MIIDLIYIYFRQSFAYSQAIWFLRILYMQGFLLDPQSWHGL